LRRSQPVFALTSFAVVRFAIHPCNKLQGILAKPNKNRGSATRRCFQPLIVPDSFSGLLPGEK